MALFDNLLGVSEDQLAKPAPGEDSNLPVHVELCARRYKTLADKSRNLERMMWIVIALLVINIGPEKIGLIAKLF
jgi:hypothetical protein